MRFQHTNGETDMPYRLRSMRCIRCLIGGAGLTLFALATPAGSLVAQDVAVPDPRTVLGLEIGADSVLADWSQIGAYFTALARRSEAVRLDTIGRTTLGKPLLMATITAPRHQGNLEVIRQQRALLADPRRLRSALEDSLVRSMPSVVFINNNIHSTEVASSQFSMQLAHRLVTDPRYRQVLENVIVLMTPSANPDGLDTVVAWYRQHKGSRFEAGPLPWLYHPYVGHDNNRDWFMLTQVESQAIARVLYREWFPEVVWDVHQMGNSGPRLFLPPFSDPVNPNLDPIVVEAINLVGTAMAASVYDAGKTGVAHQTRFDLWWHGGFRTIPARHNMIGILSEAASARLASPIFQSPEALRRSEPGVNYPGPWEGGWWRLGDIIEYELLAADGLLQLVAAQRERFVRRFVTLGRRAIAAGEAGNPYAFLLPPDQRDRGAEAALLQALLGAGIEIRRATEPFTADGDRHPAGTLVIPMAQPFRAHVKDLLELQSYPDRRQYPGGPPETPYDVAGWTLPMQLGLDVRTVAQPFEVRSELVRTVEPRPGSVIGSGPQWVLTNRAAAESRTIVEALRLGARVWVSATPIEVNGTTVPAGSVVLAPAGRQERLAELVREHTAAYGFDAWGTRGLRAAEGTIARLPRIGLYKPWVASMDEGWTRWVLEQHGIPYVTVTDSMVRAGRLDRRLDVLLLPDVSANAIVRGYPESIVPAPYAGGIGESGVAAMVEFVRGGGTLVTLDGSSDFAIEHLGLPVRNGLGQRRGMPDAEDFYAPGSVFAVEVRPGTPLTSGMDSTAFVYFANGAAFEASAPAEVLARFADAPLRSGYALNQEQLAHKAALVDVKVGDGRAILFGFRPQHRGQTHGTFKLLFNALLLSGPS